LCSPGTAAGFAYANISTGAATVFACANATSARPSDSVQASAGFKVPLRLLHSGNRSITADWTISWQLIGWSLVCDLAVEYLNDSAVGPGAGVALGPSKYGNTANQSISVTWNGTLMSNQPYWIIVGLAAYATSSLYSGTYAWMTAAGTLNQIQIA
jgi:hypothetical protein